MPRPRLPLNAKQEGAIRAEARGEPHEYILQEFFGVAPDADPKDIHNAECKLHRLRKRPEYDAVWADELKKTVRRYVPGALQTIVSQARSKSNDWLANKAANDCLTLAGRVGVIANADESEITVRFENMPELGSPDTSEDV